MTTEIDAKREKIAKIVEKALPKEKRIPLAPEQKLKHALKMGSRVVPEMPGRIGWSSVGCYGYGTVEVLRGEMDYRFWRIALVVAAKILENPEALRIESVADLEKRERELQECLTDDQKKAGLQVIVRPVVSFPLKYAQDVLQLKHLREAELAALERNDRANAPREIEHAIRRWNVMPEPILKPRGKKWAVKESPLTKEDKERIRWLFQKYSFTVEWNEKGNYIDIVVHDKVHTTPVPPRVPTAIQRKIMAARDRLIKK